MKHTVIMITSIDDAEVKFFLHGTDITANINEAEVFNDDYVYTRATWLRNEIFISGKKAIVQVIDVNINIETH